MFINEISNDVLKFLSSFFEIFEISKIWKEEQN